jgi:hypothetical protein
MTMPGRSCVALTLLIVVCGPDRIGAECSLESLQISEIPAGNKPFGKSGVGLRPVVARGMTRGTLGGNASPARNYSIRGLIRTGQSPTFQKKSSREGSPDRSSYRNLSGSGKCREYRRWQAQTTSPAWRRIDQLRWTESTGHCW